MDRGLRYAARSERRDHSELGSTWMADSGRDLYKTVRASDRLTANQVSGAAATLEAAVKESGYANWIELFRGKVANTPDCGGAGKAAVPGRPGRGR